MNQTIIKKEAGYLVRLLTPSIPLHKGVSIFHPVKNQTRHLQKRKIPHRDQHTPVNLQLKLGAPHRKGTQMGSINRKQCRGRKARARKSHGWNQKSPYNIVLSLICHDDIMSGRILGAHEHTGVMSSAPPCRVHVKPWEYGTPRPARPEESR